MSEAKHTPGPWEFGPSHSSTGLAGQLVVRPAGEFPHGEWVADVGSMYDDHRVANARLIAAAPELLEALKEVTMVLDRIFDVEDRTPEPNSISGRARAAIAKATGQEEGQ